MTYFIRTHLCSYGQKMSWHGLLEDLYSDAGIKSEKLQSSRKFVVHLYQKLLQSYVILRAWEHQNNLSPYICAEGSAIL